MTTQESGRDRPERPSEPDTPGGGEQDPEKDGSDSSLEEPGPREGNPDKPDSPGGGQN